MATVTRHSFLQTVAADAGGLALPLPPGRQAGRGGLG
jgi:hypothetical protein